MTRREFFTRLGRYGWSAIFLGAGLSWLSRFVPVARSRDPSGAPKPPVTPPGSFSRRHFATNCTGCRRCVASCPTGVLQPAVLEYGLAGVLQPVLDFQAGYCEYPCTACSSVCPTGAIRRISVAAKRQIQIGRVFLVKEDCIVFARGTSCGACAEICPTQAVQMVSYRPGLTQPIVEAASCVGCGACEYVCPARPRKSIYVVGTDPHGTATPAEERRRAPNGLSPSKPSTVSGAGEPRPAGTPPPSDARPSTDFPF